MTLPGIQKNGVQRRVHRSNHVIHPVMAQRVSINTQQSTLCHINSSNCLPWADAFGHSDDVIQAGRCFDLCPRAHCHGD